MNLVCVKVFSLYYERYFYYSFIVLESDYIIIALESLYIAIIKLSTLEIYYKIITLENYYKSTKLLLLLFL